MKNSKKALVHAYTKLNVGDDLFLLILAKKYPDVIFYVCSDYDYSNTFLSEVGNILFVNKGKVSLVNRIGNYFGKTFRLQKIRSLFLQKILNDQYRDIISSIDSIVVIGGSMFIQNDECMETYDMAIYQYFSEFDNISKFIIGSNFGPYYSNSYLSYFQDCFEKFNQINFRERASFELFKKLTNVGYYPDIVFSLDVNDVFVDYEEKRKSVGFSLVSIEKFEFPIAKEVYYNTLKNIVDVFLNKNYDVNFYAFSSMEGDLDFLEELKSFCCDNHESKEINVIPYKGDKYFITDFYNNDVLFCGRFHAMILGLLARKKMFVIPYGNKMTNVIEDYDLSIKVLDFKEPSILFDNDMINGVNGNLEIIENLIQDANKNFTILDEEFK